MILDLAKLCEQNGLSVRDLSSVTADILMGKALKPEDKKKLVLAAFVNNGKLCMSYVTHQLKLKEPGLPREIFEIKTSPQGIIDYLYNNVEDTSWLEAAVMDAITNLMTSDNPFGKMMAMIMGGGR